MHEHLSRGQKTTCRGAVHAFVSFHSSNLEVDLPQTLSGMDYLHPSIAASAFTKQ